MDQRTSRRQPDDRSIERANDARPHQSYAGQSHPLRRTLCAFAPAVLSTAEHFFTDDVQLHQLIPSILSILLTTDLAPSIDPEPNQLYIRDYASQLLARILTTYAGAYISLQPRVLKTLLTGLSGKGDLYGAIRGLTALSREAVLSTLGKAQNLRALDAMLSGRDDERRDRIIEIVLVRLTLVSAMSKVLRYRIQEALQTAFAATPLSTAEVEELADAEAVTKWGSTLASEIQSRPGLALSLLALETAPDTLLAMPAVEVEAPSMRASTSAEESGMDVES